MSEVKTGAAAPSTVTGIGVVDSTGVVKPLGGTAGVSLVVDTSTGDGVLTGDGTKNVATAGTRVALATTTACKWVVVSARPANTGKIVVGTVTCVAAAGSERGIVLAAGQAAAIPATNLASVYIDSTVNGEGVAFAYGA